MLSFDILCAVDPDDGATSPTLANSLSRAESPPLRRGILATEKHPLQDPDKGRNLIKNVC